MTIDYKSLESRHSPEGRAQAVRAASIREMWAQDDYLPNPYVPTVADLAKLETDEDLAIAHAKVLRTLYQFTEDGASKVQASIPEPACAYLVDMVRYLCSIGAGIQWPIESEHEFFDAVNTDPNLPRHWRDATATLFTILMEPGFTDSFHRDVLTAYMDTGYISDDPSTSKLAPPNPFATWTEACAFAAQPQVISVLIERGVDFSFLPTPSVVNLRTIYESRLRTSRSPEAVAARDRILNGLRECMPGDYIGFFKLVSFTSSKGTRRDSPLCMQTLAEMESAGMMKSLIGRVKSAAKVTRP